VPPELPKTDTGAADPFKNAPKPIELPPPPKLPVVVQKISVEKEIPSIKMDDFVLNAVSNAVVLPLGQSENENISVLCIDDEPDVIEILRNYLVPEGYKVFSASNGVDGLRLAEKLQPNVITLDIQMPEKDGWEVLRELKANPFTREIPVLIHSIVDNKPLAYSLGAVDYMPKPADAGVVLRMVRKAVTSTDNYILVVEDELDYSVLLQKFLKDAGYAVEGAYNGKEALEKIEENKPALILLDLKMPVMDGFEVLKQLKERNDWQTIPIVIITAMELSTDQRNEIDKQTIDFLRKTDYSMESLSNLIKKSLTA
jgi:CheY-like chemotaxis protein